MVKTINRPSFDGIYTTIYGDFRDYPHNQSNETVLRIQCDLSIETAARLPMGQFLGPKVALWQSKVE